MYTGTHLAITIGREFAPLVAPPEPHLQLGAGIRNAMQTLSPQTYAALNWIARPARITLSARSRQHHHAIVIAVDRLSRRVESLPFSRDEMAAEAADMRAELERGLAMDLLQVRGARWFMP